MSDQTLRYIFMATSLCAATVPRERGTLLVDELNQVWAPNGSGGHGKIASLADAITVTGTLGVGNVLTAAFPTGVGAVKWQRFTTGSWVDIAGATSLTYTQVLADAGQQIRPIATSFAPFGSAVSVPAADVGLVQFAASTFAAAEGTATVTVTVTRTGGSIGAASVNYATSNGTATAGSDYTAASGTLNWTDGDSANKTFTISITNDAGIESSETINVTLSGATGSTLGAQSTAVVNITDNDSATVPGAATIGAATAGNTTASVAFTAPGSTGGSAILDYRITASTGQVVTGVSASPGTITGLTNGVSSTFTVAARNAVGYGPESAASNSVTPSAGVDSRPGWFAAPTNAATVGTAGFVSGRTILAGSANGGKAGSSSVTTTGSDYAWFAIANAGSVTFFDGVFSGGFTLIGAPFVDSNSTSWYLYRSDFPASYTAQTLTIS